jgi:hypothetical protein
MNRRIILGLLLAVVLGTPVFAQSDASIPSYIRDNRYFIESVRLADLARAAFEEGDYDASTRYSEEAIRFASLSDDWVRLQLKIKETDDAIAAARLRLEWASSPAVDAQSRYPEELDQALTAFTSARTLRSAERWDPAIVSANRVLSVLALLTEAPPAPIYPLPAQYTIYPWEATRDCFWNVAGQPWAYNDPEQWRLLYNANRAKLPQPDNPDLIRPGTILDIPSIRGEIREGMWVEGRDYAPLP